MTRQTIETEPIPSLLKMATAPTTGTTFCGSAIRKPYVCSKFRFQFHPFSSHSSKPTVISCTIADRALRMDNGSSNSTLLQRPDSFGRFGKFGGKYVPETLMHALSELESAFHSLASDHDFQVCFLSQHLSCSLFFFERI